MDKIYFAIAIGSVCIASFSQILLKMGAGKKYDRKIREYFNVFVIGGYGMLFVSMLLTILAYSRLSYLSVPVVEAAGYALVPMLSCFFLKEKLSIRKILGILVIMAGMILYYL